MSSNLTIQFNNAFTLFLSLLVEAMPFLLLGVLFSGILMWFVDDRQLIKILPRNPLLGALAGSLVGFLFPVCECGNVPVARRFLIQGVPLPVAIGFLLAAPTINPIVIWATWTAFRDQPEMVVLRVICSLAIATSIGLVFSAQKDLRAIVQPAIARLLPPDEPPQNSKEQLQETSPLLKSGTYLLGQPGQPLRLDSMSLVQIQTNPPSGFLELEKTANSHPSNTDKGSTSFFQRVDKTRLFSLLESMVQELRELGGVLVIGSAIAAIIQVAAPREIILSLGQGPVTSILAMLTLGAVVSICSTVDAFFALSFASTFTTGSLLAFLVFGPMVDIKSVGLMLSVFKTKAVVYLMLLAAQLSFLMSLVVNLYLS